MKKIEFYEGDGAQERMDTVVRKVLAYGPMASKGAKQLAKADAKPVSQSLNRS